MLFPYFLLLWLLIPIFRSPYLADDIPNSQRPAFLSIENESIWAFTVRLTRQWIHNEGRFFPVSVFENTLVFTVFHERWMYKSLQVVSVLLLAATFGWLIRIVTKDKYLAALAVVLFGASLQVRTWYDPTISFGILLPSTGIKALLALSMMILGIRASTSKCRLLYLLAAGLLWMLALMQYEVVITLGIIAFMLAGCEREYGFRRQALGFSSILLPSLFFFSISRYFRHGVTANPAYQTNLDISTVFKTLRYQIEGALPLTVPYSRVDGRVAVGGSISNMPLVQIVMLLIASAVIVIYLLRMRHSSVPTRLVLIISGCCLLVLPAIPTSLSVRWQTEVGPGHAYLPVMLQYLGTSLVLLILLLEAKQRISRVRDLQLKKLLLTVSMIVVAISSVIVVATNKNGIEYTVESSMGFRTDREIFEAAAKLGIFDIVSANTTLVSNQANEVMWTNKTYLNWLGGPAVSAFVTPTQLKECRANDDENCLKRVGGIYDVSQTVKGSTRATVVALSVSNELEIRTISRERESLPCGIENSVKNQGWWITRCAARSLSVSQDFQLQYLSQ